MEARELLSTMRNYGIRAGSSCLECPVTAVWGLGSFKGPRLSKIVGLSTDSCDRMLSLIADATADTEALSFRELFARLQKMPLDAATYGVFVLTKPEARDSGWTWIAYTPVKAVALTRDPRLFAVVPQSGGIIVTRAGPRIGCW